MSKKTVLIHSNFCRAFTGFGKNKKNIMRYLFDTGKYNLVELANGIEWDSPATQQVPWECRGASPPAHVIQSIQSEEEKRDAGYGAKLIDKAIQEFKPDVYIGMEDIWAFNNYNLKPWWHKINTMIWTTLDSLPILPQAVDFAPKVKHYYVWSSFAEKAMKELGYDHVKTLRGSLDENMFFRHNEEDRKKLRESHGLTDEFIVGFVFRNQLRKSVPNILEGFKLFKQKNPKAKLLLHTHWSEGWDIPRLLNEKNIDPSDVLTTYVCSNCLSYEIRPFSGQEQKCNKCGSEKTLNTTNTSRGVTDQQLNEIYNLMDVYCHPFTSGGQEIPIQEAKLSELITLVTNYSCGEDTCTEESGGFPLEWSEYREPGTQFIKASTHASDICDKLELVWLMDKEEKRATERKARQWTIENFSTESIGKQLEQIIDAMPSVDYDFDPKDTIEYNPDYEPLANYISKEEFLIDIYKNIIRDDVDANSQGFKHWMGKLNSGTPAAEIVNYFKNVAREQLSKSKTVELSDILGEKDKGKRIAVVIPQTETDVLLVNSLIKNLKKQYKNYNIYIFTNPQYFPFIDDNPYVHRVIAYSPVVENSFVMEGAGDHEGLFEMVFYPNTTTQKNISFIHNGLNKHQFSLR
jgi:glycosyltransferase involved in cell wall biosynthesis